jgi:hypothetical protein
MVVTQRQEIGRSATTRQDAWARYGARYPDEAEETTKWSEDQEGRLVTFAKTGYRPEAPSTILRRRSRSIYAALGRGPFERANSMSRCLIHRAVSTLGSSGGSSRQSRGGQSRKRSRDKCEANQTLDRRASTWPSSSR